MCTPHTHAHTHARWTCEYCDVQSCTHVYACVCLYYAFRGLLSIKSRTTTTNTCTRVYSCKIICFGAHSTDYKLLTCLSLAPSLSLHLSPSFTHKIKSSRYNSVGGEFTFALKPCRLEVLSGRSPIIRLISRYTVFIPAGS